MRKSYPVALGGVLAALAVVIMTLGGMIPVATYISPMLCALLLFCVKNYCGNVIAWCWYSCVCILGILLSPDKESAGVFAVIGYYPIIQPIMEKSKLQWIFKLLFFNCASVSLYLVLIYLFGMQQLLAEFLCMGIIGLAGMLALGNICFILLDRLLHLAKKKFFK